MIRKIYTYVSSSTDPYENLSIEQMLLEQVDNESVILYLWQNAHTVVIGRNQNPTAECRCALLEENGGRLARRMSGGGAVYHDLGNLNFTFLCHSENYDLERQLGVVEKACLLAGVPTERSGRNDLLADGRKFSGNAFYNAKGRSYHHGTILVDADRDKMERYLTPPTAKLVAKGVSSVRSRVVNLRELVPSLTIETMKTCMIQAFEKVYNMGAKLFVLDTGDLSITRQKLCSWEHLYGATPPYSLTCQKRFDWGNIELSLDVKNGIIHDITVFTDAMDHTLAKTLKGLLSGIPFTVKDVKEALSSTPCGDDLFSLLSQVL